MLDIKENYDKIIPAQKKGGTNMKKDKVYGFTNENLAVFPEIYNFTNANILTVLGSGDQYFQAKLNGAQNVDVFDINYLAWHHFVLKYTAIKILSYEDFMQMFIKDGLDNQVVYTKLRLYLIDEVKNFFDKLIELQRKFSSIKISNAIFNNSTKDYIPYLNKEKYYQLQNILGNSSLPNFYNCNLTDLPKHLNNSYDIAIFSNIYHYLGMDVKTYRDFLNQFHCQDILALYTWILNKDDQRDFLSNGFAIYKVEGVIDKKDYVVSLKRQK